MRTIGKTAFTAFLTLAASQAAAQTVLWGKVEAGMPFEKAKALYPDGRVYSGKGLFGPMISISDYDIDGCKASVDIQMDREVADSAAKVQAVRLSGQKCDAKMFAQLIARYGEPQANNDDNRKQKKKKAVWIAEGKSISFKVTYGSPDFWELTYSPVKDLGL